MEILKLIRIKHWIKNLFVFVPAIFARKLTDFSALANVVELFFLFSFTASLIYVINDLHDKDKDKLHPAKKKRPLASGKVKVSTAYLVAAFLSLSIFIFAYLFDFHFNTLAVVAAYFATNIFYTFKLKKIPLVDILTISSGYVMRIYAGAFVVGVPVSQWLIVTVLFLSLFLAALKRGAEFRKHDGKNDTRVVLKEYSAELINLIITVATTGVIISYLLYSISDKIYSELHSYNFVFTSIFVIYGLFRILLLYFKNIKGEDAIELLVNDLPSMINLILYSAAVFYLIYRH